MNNAGFVLGVDRVGDIAETDVEAMFNTNVLGLISVTQLLVKGMLMIHYHRSRCIVLTLYADFKARNTGHIINLGSVAGM